MANVYDFLGDDLDLFMKSSLKVYSDISGALQYVGKTENEKTLRPGAEYIEWYDNTGGVQVLYARDNDKFGMAVDFAFKQVADNNAVALAFNLDWDKSDPVWDYEFGGSNPNELRTAKWVFTGQTRSGLDMELHIRKGVITINGDWTLGAPGSYTQIPVTCSAFQDTTIANTLRDLFYFRIQKQTSGS